MDLQKQLAAGNIILQVLRFKANAFFGASLLAFILDSPLFFQLSGITVCLYVAKYMMFRFLSYLIVQNVLNELTDDLNYRDYISEVPNS